MQRRETEINLPAGQHTAPPEAGDSGSRDRLLSGIGRGGNAGSVELHGLEMVLIASGISGATRARPYNWLQGQRSGCEGLASCKVAGQMAGGAHQGAGMPFLSGVPVNPSTAQVGPSVEAQAGSESIKMRLRRENEHPEMRNSTRRPDSLVFIGRSCGKLSFSAVPGKEV